MPSITLKSGREKSLLRRHPWIFSGAVARVDGNPSTGETVDVLIRFDGYRGLYLLHCHKLEHEDMGMMTNFEVV